jgi:hypothetical protein
MTVTVQVQRCARIIAVEDSFRRRVPYFDIDCAAVLSNYSNWDRLFENNVQSGTRKCITEPRKNMKTGLNLKLCDVGSYSRNGQGKLMEIRKFA